MYIIISQVLSVYNFELQLNIMTNPLIAVVGPSVYVNTVSRLHLKLKLLYSPS